MFTQQSRDLLALAGFVIILAGCATSAASGSPDEERLTVGTAQREIRLGMSGADVAASMGSPNIVSSDPERNEVWIYDRLSTEYVRTDRSVGALIVGVGGSVGGAASGKQSNSKGTRTQRTLTVIVWFDDGGLVRDFSYHSSRF